MDNGLQLRLQPNKKIVRTPLRALVNDDANVERQIERQALKNKSDIDVQELHRKALQEDPSAFDYDAVYDDIKQAQFRPVVLDRKDRQPRYIAAIKEKVKQREREQEIIYESKLAKERSKEEHMYADKDKFVTNAYKRKLAEQEKWKEEERLRELEEEKEHVTKKADISDFYFNLAKNVAFGAAKDTDKSKFKKQHLEAVAHSPKQVSPPAAESSTLRPVSETAMDVQNTGTPPASNQPKPDHHRTSEDAYVKVVFETDTLPSTN